MTPSEPDPVSSARPEFYAGPALSVQPLRDADGFTVSDVFVGAAAGVRFYPCRTLSLGVEGQYFPGARSAAPFVNYIRQRAVYAVARWSLTPDTFPAFYVEAGAGRMHSAFKLELFRGRETRLSSAVFFIGAGSALRLGRGWTLDASLRAARMRKTDFGFLLYYASSTALQAAASVSKRF